MEIKTVLVSVFVAALGIAVAVAGFRAEATKVKKNEPTLVWVGLEPECEYPSSPAMGLAIAATVVLVIARAIITSTTGGCCSCCVRSIPNGPKKNCGRVCIVISWITSSIAVILFLVGAKLSSQNSAATMIDGEYVCYTVRSGLFSAAGIIGLVSMLLGLVYYHIYVLGRSGAPDADLELEGQTITDGKKPTH
ncbi:hypothetical protein SSX86_012107 [Deinandra increscens subsp. villosa]|uniref:Uncharacterized protein n=1 Tax=Deinandra increscens subsp. villosa TaxID=3103831 RepID=A0AAP0H095_9ASTR